MEYFMMEYLGIVSVPMVLVNIRTEVCSGKIDEHYPSFLIRFSRILLSLDLHVRLCESIATFCAAMPTVFVSDGCIHVDGIVSQENTGPVFWMQQTLPAVTNSIRETVCKLWFS